MSVCFSCERQAPCLFGKVADLKRAAQSALFRACRGYSYFGLDVELLMWDGKGCSCSGMGGVCSPVVGNAARRWALRIFCWSGCRIDAVVYREDTVHRFKHASLAQGRY